jgi:uncharacterized protein YjbI with pentapeptide repeats
MRTRRLLVLTLLVGAVSVSATQADIYRYDTGEVIPGTEGITPGPGMPFGNQDAEYGELSGLDLTGSDFAQSNLSHANLRRSKLTGANFEGADLSSAALSQSMLDGANMAGATVTYAGFDLAIGFTAAQLYSTASYQRKELRGIGLGYTDLTNWDFSGQNLSDAVLGYSNLSGVNLTDAVVTGVYFPTNVTAAQLYSTASYRAKDLHGIGLYGNDLIGWDFSGQNLSDASLRSNLTRASLIDANLSNAWLDESTLRDANLTGSVVVGADFRATTPLGFTAAQLYSTASYQQKGLQGIKLTDNDLSNWDFSGQNLSYAFLAGSTLTGANLAEAVVTAAGFGATTSLGFTAKQLYSTASYQRKDLQGIGLGYGNDLSNWDFSGQNLAGASFNGSMLIGADLTGALVTGADFGNTTSLGFTAAQLYSTANYLAKDLHGIGLANNDLTGWDLSGQNLRNAFLGWSVLTDANMTDVRLENAYLNESSLGSALLDSATTYNQWTVFPSGFDPASAGFSFVESQAGDFDASGLLDISDVQMLQSRMRGLLHSLPAKQWWLPIDMYDVNADSNMDKGDLLYWIHELKRTWIGDANLDGEFNSGDLVLVLTAGEYEDMLADHSNWATGDWDADGDFTSSDLVFALADGGYEQGPRPAAAAVPEPSSLVLVVWVVIITVAWYGRGANR